MAPTRPTNPSTHRGFLYAERRRAADRDVDRPPGEAIIPAELKACWEWRINGEGRERERKRKQKLARERNRIPFLFPPPIYPLFLSFVSFLLLFLRSPRNGDAMASAVKGERKKLSVHSLLLVGVYAPAESSRLYYVNGYIPAARFDGSL